MSLFGIIPPAWQEYSKCSQPNPRTGKRPNAKDWWTESLSQSMRKRRIEAQTLCRGCQVIPECAEFAHRTRAVGVVMAGVALGPDREENELRGLYGQLYGLAHSDQKETR